MNMLDKLIHSLGLLQQKRPLILCLTNYVTVEFVANSLLAIRASPIMSEELEELEKLIQISHALSINIGTLTQEFITKAKFACAIAKKYNKPIILDPVGAGASNIRTQAANDLLPFADIVRGNASEILAIFDSSNHALGVDSAHQVTEAMQIAKFLALKNNCVVVVSGEQDFITDGKQEQILHFGADLMPLVTGMGCSLTAIITAFRAVIPDSFEAAKLATAYFGLSGQVTEKFCKAPGTFKSSFIDHLYQPKWDEIKNYVK